MAITNILAKHQALDVPRKAMDTAITRPPPSIVLYLWSYMFHDVFTALAALRKLVIINDGDRVLLGEKKRGFGAGYFNGFGGKVEPGETIREAAQREVSKASILGRTPFKPYCICNMCTSESKPLWEIRWRTSSLGILGFPVLPLLPGFAQLQEEACVTAQDMTEAGGCREGLDCWRGVPLPHNPECHGAPLDGGPAGR